MACKGKKKKGIVAALLAALVVALSGCSHNIVTYGDGVGFETTLRPDSGNFGVTFRYGKILSIAARENFEAEMVGSGKGDAADGKGGASSDGSVKVKIGKQITGYYVDAIKAGATPKQIDEYLDAEK